MARNGPTAGVNYMDEDRLEKAIVRHASAGVCRSCDGVFGRSGMTAHLKACPKRTAEQDTGGRGNCFHLFINGGPDYWLHVEIAGDAALSDLDHFLRDIWLECCGHISGFTIEKTRYSSHPMKDWEEKGMSAGLHRILRPGMKFCYEYDSGTTTLLRLKVLSVRPGRLGKKWIRILARNNPPAIPCAFCLNPATNLCPFCLDENTGFVCDDCLDQHECGDNDGDLFKPLVNSPRTGRCGYSGPSREPH